MSGSVAEVLGLPPDHPALVGPLPCERCGVDLRSLRAPQRLCLNRCCVELFCWSCGHVYGGWGPVGCRCQAGGPNPLAIDGAAYRRRIRNRRR